jgi:hypothetical protein
MKTYTVFCTGYDHMGTTWIGYVRVEDEEQARTQGRIQCAEDWGYDVEDVTLLGIIEGEAKIICWNDQPN